MSDNATQPPARPSCTRCYSAGCYLCCPLCNADDHRCPGCGITLTHRVRVCMDCRRDLERDRLTTQLADVLRAAAEPAGARTELTYRMAAAAVTAGWRPS